MFLAGAVGTWTTTTRVAGHPLALVADRHSPTGGMDLDCLLYQVMRHRVVVLVVFDVVIDMHACLFDIGILVGLGSQYTAG